MASNYVVAGLTTPAGINSREAVMAEQKRLNAAGASLKVDGLWGPNTKAAYENDATQTQQKNLIQNMLTSAQSAVSRVGKSYDAAGRQYTAAQNAAYESAKTSLQNQEGKVNDQYDDIRSQAYVNARLQSVGNNEALAAKGLAGNMYGEDQSGVSETSKITQNTSMQNSINTATEQEQAAIDEIAQAIIQAKYTTDQNVANQLASLAVQKAGAVENAQQNAVQQALALLQYQQASVAQNTSSRGGSTRKSSGLSDAALAAALSTDKKPVFSVSDLKIASEAQKKKDERKKWENDPALSRAY